MSSHNDITTNPSKRDFGDVLLTMFVVLAILSFIGGFAVLWPDEVPVKPTLLEQRAGDLATANIEICGMSATQLNTGIGVINIDPNIQALITNQMKAGVHSVIEIAYSPEDMIVHLVGDANVTRGTYHCN